MIARLALAAALLAAPALAQPIGPPPGGPPPGEGPHPARQQIFISPSGEPFRAPMGQPYPVNAWFARADADHDGVLTAAEFTADALAFYTRLDADHDGWLDGFEIADYEKTVAPEILSRLDRGLDGPGGGQGGGPAGRGGPMIRRKGGGPPAGGGGGGMMKGGEKRPYGLNRSGAGLYGLINEVQPVMAQDSDFNRRVERKEVLAAARDRFAILDKDRNGRLALADLPKTPFQTLLEAPPPKDAKRGRPPAP